MASSRGKVHSETAKKEQIITEFFNKTLQIILESRLSYVSSRNHSGEQFISSPSSSSSSSSSFRSRDKWFNLGLKECPEVLENIDFWRQSNLEPMVVDVILVQNSLGKKSPIKFSLQRDFVNNPEFLNSEFEDFGIEPRNEKVIERWVVQYETRKSRDNNVRSKKSSNNLHSLYKKSIVLLRSLYVTIRLLPAYKLFRNPISSGKNHAYSLIHRVSSFVEPFTSREETNIQRYSFTPIETSCDRLMVSVSYHRSVLSNLSSDPSNPLSPRFISDYVGSPLPDPLKRFPSLPRSHGSPLWAPFGRRHSWSYDNYRASFPSNMPPSPSPSPSPTYSDSQHFRGIPKNINYDEYWPSRLYSPSPPMCIGKNYASKGLFRCESAPVNMPLSKGFNKQALPPSPPFPKLTRASTFKQDRSTCPSGLSIEKVLSLLSYHLGALYYGLCQGQ